MAKYEREIEYDAIKRKQKQVELFLDANHKCRVIRNMSRNRRGFLREGRSLSSFSYDKRSINT